MRIVFMGTGDIALPTLRLVAERYRLVGLVTQPDKPAGRHATPQPPRIKELAGALGAPVLQPERVGGRRALAGIAALDPEIIVVMAYGQLLPPVLLEMPARGCINVHASLLPRHRGASCIQAAIESGDAESGVSVMHMAVGLDTGDVILKRAVRLAPAETGGSLHDRLAELAPEVLEEALRAIEKGTATRSRQDEALATYASKLDRGDGEIDWSRAARELERRVRAYDPWPGTFTTWRDERGRTKRLKVFPPTGVAQGDGVPGEVLEADRDGLAVACGEGALRLTIVQPEGGRRMGARDFLAGHPMCAGDRFFSLEKGHE